MLTENQVFIFGILLFAFIGVATLWRQGWMGLCQMAIFIGVVCSDIYWELGAKGLSIYVVAGIAAYLFTVIPLKLYDWSMRIQRKIEDTLTERRLRASRRTHIDFPRHR